MDIKTIQEKLGDVKKLVVAQHNETGHFYRHVPTSLVLPSVTTKLGILEGGQHLKVWSSRLAVEKLTERLTANPTVLSKSTIADMEVLETYQHEAILAHKDMFEDAGSTGTRGHSVLEDYLTEWINKNEKPILPITSFIKEEEKDSRIWAIARSAELFIKDFHAIPVASEFFVVSVKHKFAGTLDALMMVIIAPEKCTQEGHVFFNRSSKNPFKMACVHCELKKDYVFALCDWKSSNTITNKPEYIMQVSAYWHAMKEMFGFAPPLALIIRLDKKQAKYEVIKIENKLSAFKTFLSLSKVYDWLHDGTKKESPCNPKEIISLI